MNELVYRISTAEEWDLLQSNGSTFGGEIDKASGFIHLSKLDQVRGTLDNFFLNSEEELYLLQIDVKKLGDGLVYENVDGSNSFPHFYGPSRSFVPLPLEAVTKAEKLTLTDGHPSTKRVFVIITFNQEVWGGIFRKFLINDSGRWLQPADLV